MVNFNNTLLRCAALVLFFIRVVQSQGTDLGQGVVTRVDVERYADIALDIRDFRIRLVAGDQDSALHLYLNGLNSVISATQKFNLREMSSDLAKLNLNQRSPTYNYHLYGLADRDIENMGTHALYADNFVKSFISSSSEVAADAVVALHTWMYGTHLLYNGINTCRLLSNADNPDIFQLNGGGMDEFIALWIGHDQTAGSTDGHSLYAMTQRAAELFGTSAPESPVNDQIKVLYNEGAIALAFPNPCSRNNGDTIPALWSVTQRIISLMYIPLMQLLLDAIIRQDPNYIRLYALAVVPQVSQCRPSIYKRLKETLLDGTVNANRVSETISDLQAIYDCLGFQCSDIGSYKGGQIPQCNDIPVNQPMAEYAPSSRVHQHSKIDLDILQIRILTSLESYAYAKDLYMYGRNSEKYRESDDDPYLLRSLMEMATSNARKAADPFYTDFVSYFNDPNYADTMVKGTLDRTNKWGSASPAQITEVVAKTSAYQILYMNVLAELAEAVAACKAGDMLTGDGGAHQWDEVAAFLIGSLEGSSEGGSSDLEDGQLMWNLANKRAFQFQTVNEMGFSIIDSKLEDLLFAGRGEADALACESLQRSMNLIQNLMLLPIIQSTIRYAIINDPLTANSQSDDLARGETFALSVLPIVKKYEANAAAVIQENMIVVPGENLVRDGAQAVANAFYLSLKDFGYSCALVGAAPQADACQLEGGFAEVKKKENSASQRLVSLTLCSVIIPLFALWL